MTFDDVLPFLSAVGGALSTAALAGVYYQRIRSDVDTLTKSCGAKTDVDQNKTNIAEIRVTVDRIERERTARGEQIQREREALAEQRGELNQRLKTLEEDRSKVAGEIASVEGRLRGEIRGMADNILSHFDRTVEIINAHAIANAKPGTGSRNLDDLRSEPPRQSQARRRKTE